MVCGYRNEFDRTSSMKPPETLGAFVVDESFSFEAIGVDVKIPFGR